MHTRHLLMILCWTKTVGRPKKGGKDMLTSKSKPKKPPDSAARKHISHVYNNIIIYIIITILIL